MAGDKCFESLFGRVGGVVVEKSVSKSSGSVFRRLNQVASHTMHRGQPQEWYPQEVYATLRWVPNLVGIDSLRLGSRMQSTLYDYRYFSSESKHQAVVPLALLFVLSIPTSDRS